MPAPESGIAGLARLLAAMEPVLGEGEFAFCTLAEPADVARLRPWATITETEGATVILPRADADQASLAYAGAFRRITLTVHSSLTAVGLTAAVATQLAKRGISANVVAGFYHDHVFVPAHQAEAALAALRELQGRPQ